MWGQIAGAALGAAGSLFGGGSSTPKFRGYDVTSGMGFADWNKKKKSLTTTMSPTMQGFSDYFTNLQKRYGSGNTPTSPFQQFAMGDVQGMMPGLFSGAMDASGVDYGSLGQYNTQLGGLAGGMSGLLGNLGQYNQSGATGAGMGMDMYGRGVGLLGERPQSYDSVAQQRLGILRDQAAPFEERAFNGLNQNLFNTGRSGTTGGGLQTEAFARGLAQADTSRQLDAQSFAEQLYGRDQQAALQRNNMGANLMQGGMGGMFNFGNLGANLTGVGMQGMGQLGNIFGNQFNANQGFNELVNSRAQQRMQNATGMFGFGNQLSQQDIETAGGGASGFMGLNQALLDQGKIGLSAGQAAMGGGQPIPSGPSPFGSFLQGLGGAAAGGAFNGMFGGYNPNVARMAGPSFVGTSQTYAPPASATGAYNPTFGIPMFGGAMPDIGYGG